MDVSVGAPEEGVNPSRLGLPERRLDQTLSLELAAIDSDELRGGPTARPVWAPVEESIPTSPSLE